jgi:hypothetical protein
MEAIVELIGGLLVGLLELALMLIQAAGALLGLALEFLVVALTQGTSPASEKFRQRWKVRRESRAAGAPVSGRKVVAVAGLVVVGVAAVTTAGFISEHVRKKRTEATTVQIATLADRFISQIKDEGIADPEEGLLSDRDAWNQQIELFVDKALVGSMVVVRSSGSDRKSGTLDDLLAIRITPATGKQVVGELAERGLQAVRGRLARMLPGSQEKEIPEQIDLQKQ